MKIEFQIFLFFKNLNGEFDGVKFDNGYQMNYKDIPREELISEISNLKKENEALKNTDEELAQQQYLLETILNNLPDHIYFKDLESRFIRINDSHAKSLGLTHPDQAVGKTDFDFHTPELANQAFKDEQAIIKTGLPLTKEERLIRHNQPEKWVLITKLPFRNKEGIITGTFGISRDITKRILAEQAVLESEEKYRLLITNVRDVVYSVDAVTKEFKYLSPSFKRITGYTPEDIKVMGGRIPFLYKVVSEAKFAEWDNNLLQLNDGQPDTDFIHETWWLCKDGSLKYLQDHWIPIFMNGKMVSTDGVLIDITERKKAEAEIQLKNELLQTVNAEKDKFFSIIAHDLKSPLSAFLGATQILMEEIRNMTMEEIRDITLSMKESATSIYGLLENLLEWSRLQRGMMVLKPETFNLKQKITSGTEVLTESARKKNIQIYYNISEDLEVNADSHMFETVLRNLVSNAIKFTPKSGEISISAIKTPDNKVEIKIRDTGIGMNMEFINRLFLLNEKTNRVGTEGEPSTGLGLIICKEFIEKNGGNINVESEEGKGSTFSFTIPAA